jgi:hypothetical protein
MLIDEFLSAYDISARYQIEIQAPMERVYQAARSLDSNDSGIVRWLFHLRGLPASMLTLDGMLKFGFILLGETPPHELVIGLVGRFWSHSAGIQRITPEAFRAFDREGYAKAVTNISLSQGGDGLTRVATETRVLCQGEASRRWFRLYWLLIGPFSGLIRKEWLRIIKQQAERPSNPA